MQPALTPAKIKKHCEALTSAGLVVSAVQVLPDGTINFDTSGISSSYDEFDRCKAKKDARDGKN